MSNLIVDYQSHQCSIQLNRPEKRNALDMTSIQALTQAFVEANQNDDVRLIHLSAAGDHFCAGADLHWMKAQGNTGADQTQALSDMLQSMYQCNKPILCVTQGAVMGGGMGLLACCDMVVGQMNNFFCLSEAKLGLVPALIAPYVIRRTSLHFFKQHAILADRFGPPEALSANLIDQIALDASDSQSIQHQLSQQIIRNSPNAVQQNKIMLREMFPLNPEHLSYSQQCLNHIRQHPEAQAGIQAFFSKQPPPWHF